jgi:hypothetical protein
MTEMLEDMNSQPNAAEGFSAAEFYKAGQKYGVTCSEIMVNFLGKARALSRGKYPAVAPDAPLETSRKPKAAAAPKPKAAAAPKPLKVAAKKAPKKADEKPAKVPKKTKPSIADEINAELDAEDLEESGAVFVYIATPDEIAEEG